MRASLNEPRVKYFTSFAERARARVNDYREPQLYARNPSDEMFSRRKSRIILTRSSARQRVVIIVSLCELFNDKSKKI